MEDRELQIGGYIFRLRKLEDGSYVSEVVRRTFEPEPEPLIQLEGTLGSFPSKSDPQITHYVKLSKSGDVYCTCFGFKSPKKCWHYRLIKNVLDEGVTLEELLKNPITIK